jgi:PAS domain S-box-containing protein
MNKKQSELERTVHELAGIKYALDQSSIVAITDINGVILYVNDKFTEISQYPREELIGKTHRVINSGYHSKAFISNLWNTILSGKVWQGEVRNRKKDGSYYWVDTTITPLFDEQGILRRFIAIRNDITGRKIIEQKRDEFIGAASHELKTPITSQKIFIQLLMQHLQNQKDGKAVHYLNRIADQNEKLTRLINDLLDLSKIHAGQLNYTMKDFYINELIDEIVDSFQDSTPHQIVTRYQNKLQVYADQDRIAQVLINLVANAIKYSPSDTKIIISLKTDKNKVVVSVQDHGPGIDQNHHQKIFERFYRINDGVNETFPGLGLGLYIAAQIIKTHKGKIWVDSRKDKGSRFSFTLPITHNSFDNQPMVSDYSQ